MKARRNAVSRPSVVSLASELPWDQRFCTCCERRLSGKVAWLELDQRTDTYHDFGDVPDDKSQGWFPFGITCAKTALLRASVAQ